jgi:hypothetical protein
LGCCLSCGGARKRDDAGEGDKGAEKLHLDLPLLKLIGHSGLVPALCKKGDPTAIPHYG